MEVYQEDHTAKIAGLSEEKSMKGRTQVSRFEIERIDLAITSLLANQPVASESERARDQCQSAAVTPAVNASFSFLPRVSRHIIYFIAIE